MGLCEKLVGVAAGTLQPNWPTVILTQPGWLWDRSSFYIHRIAIIDH